MYLLVLQVSFTNFEMENSPWYIDFLCMIVKEILHKQPVLTLFLISALHGCLEVTETLLKRCEYAVDMKDSCGTTPLMDALRAGHIDIAKLLIEKQKVDVTFPQKIVQ